MKTLLTMMLACFCLELCAQTDVPAKKVRIVTDISTTVGNTGVRFDVLLDSTLFGDSGIIDGDRFLGSMTAPERPVIDIRDNTNDHILVRSTSFEARAGKRFVQIQMQLSDEARGLLDLLKSGRQTFYIHLDRPITIELQGTGAKLAISPETMKKVSGSSELALSQAQVDELVDAAGGYYSLYGTSLDAGWRVGGPDSATVSGYLDFSFVSRFLPGSFAEFSGILTSKANDAVSHIRLSPIVYPLMKDNNVFIKAGYELNQSGTEQRALGSLLYQGLLPNAVDLTEGSNRLRVKPLAKCGVNLLYYTRSIDSLLAKNPLAEAFLSLYYYIPVLEKYSITLQGTMFARSDKDFNFLRKNASWSWDITLGYDVPGLGTKVMAKYSCGNNDITFRKDDKILLGLLVDFFEKK